MKPILFCVLLSFANAQTCTDSCTISTTTGGRLTTRSLARQRLWWGQRNLSSQHRLFRLFGFCPRMEIAISAWQEYLLLWQSVRPFQVHCWRGQKSVHKNKNEFGSIYNKGTTSSSEYHSTAFSFCSNTETTNRSTTTTTTSPTSTSSATGPTSVVQPPVQRQVVQPPVQRQVVQPPVQRQVFNHKFNVRLFSHQCNVSCSATNQRRVAQPQVQRQVAQPQVNVKLPNHKSNVKFSHKFSNSRWCHERQLLSFYHAPLSCAQSLPHHNWTR